MALYDEDGNEVEALSGEELKALQEKAEAADKVGDYETQIAELKEAKTKLEAKDSNFSKLRGKTAAEIELLTAEWSEERKETGAALAELNEKINTFQSSQLSSYQDEVLKAIAGDDEEYKTKIKETAKEMLNMEPKNKNEILSYFQNAATLIKGSRPDINPINAFTPTVSSSAPVKKGADYTTSAEGEANYNNYFPKQ